MMTDSIIEFLRTFFLLFTTLIALFIIISFLVSLLQQIVSEEKIMKVLNHPNKTVGYMLGTLFGAATLSVPVPPFRFCRLPELEGTFRPFDEFSDCFPIDESGDDVHIMGTAWMGSRTRLLCCPRYFQHFCRRHFFKTGSGKNL